MKRILSFFAFLPLVLFCQDTLNSADKKFFMGFTFSPDYCYRTLDADASSQGIGEIRDGMEIPKFGFTSGLILSSDFYKRFTFETGLLFSNKGEKTNRIDFIYSTPDQAAPVRGSFTYNYYYLDIPLNVNYYIFRSPKHGFFLSSALVTNIFLTQSIVTHLEYSDGHKEKSSSPTREGLSAISLSYNGGFGYHYWVSEKSSLKIRPIYRRSITSIISAPVKGYLNSIGLDMGFFLKL